MENTMISTLKKILFHQDGQGHLRTPQDETAEFLVRHHDIEGNPLLQGWGSTGTGQELESPSIRQVSV